MKTDINERTPRRTVRTVSEAEGIYTHYSNLCELIAFADSSLPERQDAAARISYALDNYTMTERQRRTLELIVEALAN